MGRKSVALNSKMASLDPFYPVKNSAKRDLSELNKKMLMIRSGHLPLFRKKRNIRQKKGIY